MKYASNNIRNILIAGHAGSGKTTLTEALVYFSGAAERMGRVEDGTTISDFDPEEAKRKASLSASVVPVEYEGISDFTTFLNLVGESGQSSWEYLQNVIPAGYKEHQEVAVTIAAAKHFLGGKGAVRVHGGGFAGTVQAFVPVDIANFNSLWMVLL